MTKTRKCAECGTEFDATPSRGKKKHFCCPRHQEDHKVRRTVRGKQLITLALGWRATGGKGDLGRFLFGEMTSLLDDMIAEDRAKGRMRADEYAALVVDFNTTNPMWSSRWMDRQGKRTV